MSRYEGRLELTWTNKDQCLLAHEDGSYEWLPRSDYRVAEVRLLKEVRSVGVVGERRAKDNLLIEGDALHALRYQSSVRSMSARSSWSTLTRPSIQGRRSTSMTMH